MQEHRARRLHWDLRLEHDGTLVSWALPRGIPAHPDENRLAVHTEDHPLEYLEFQGEIPKGEYGAGTMTVWDSGTYEAEKFRENEVIATFHGERMRGRYALFHTRDKDWLIHRMDPPEDPGYVPMPDRLEPMLARSGQLPRNERDYGFEVKWDGIRTVLFSDHGHITLQGRNFTDFTPRYPEVREFSRAQGARRLILDGEIVAFDDEGRPSFERLQSRMHLASDSAVKRRMRDTPVTYIIFDLLYLDGRLTLPLAYEDRRALLEELALEGPSWRTPAYHRGEGSALLEATRQHGIEGVLAKRLDSPYEPGRRASHWIKVKNVCDPGRRDRRLDAGRGRAQRQARCARGRRDGRRQARLRGQGRHRLHAGDADHAHARAGAAQARRRARSRGVSRPRARSSSSRSWWPPSSSASGPAAGPCGRPPSRACARTRTRKNASAKQGKPGSCGYLHLYGTCDLERSDQFRAGQHPREAVQRGLAQDGALPPARPKSGQRIRQQRVGPDGEEVTYEDIVKGYEISPERYVMIAPEELESLEPKKTRTIDIEDFVDLDQIDPMYYDHPYYLAPDKGAAKAYKLLVDAMDEASKVAIARVVIRSKETWSRCARATACWRWRRCCSPTR